MEAIPGYLIDRKLSSGGTAGVYRALDIERGHHVALKILFPKWSKEPQALELMRREAHLLKTLKHPHIVRGIASGCWRGLHWLAMEFVAGPTALDRVHGGGPLHLPAVLELARQLGEAVRYLARAGIVHGDIKPANVLLGPGGVAKLCDFGFAQVRARGPGAKSSPTPFGTPAYASPEQVEGVTDLDSRADLYGLGATLFHLASGRMPPAADPWGGLPGVPAGMPVHLKWLLNRLMAPVRGDRYGAPEEFLADLSHLAVLRSRPVRRRAAAEFRLDFN
ncbi:MAG: serine/threonine protein kinase [Planctomycetes bacterium]|nr:serine/threonine protein kinase [Planctomycetota bacterium]